MSMICSNDGMQQKFYDEKSNYWYKEDYLGTEGLSEHITSILLENSDLPHVEYKACQFEMGQKEVIGCKSKNFLKENERLVSAYELFEKYKNIDIAKKIAGQPVTDKIKYFVENVIEITGIHDFGQYLTKMLQLDAVTKNEDRHFKNICFIVDENNQFRVCPVFDNGAAFLSDKYTYGPLSKVTDDKLKSVEAKPFSTDFDEQLDACESLYPANINLKQMKEISLYSKELLTSLYGDEEVEACIDLIRDAERKYAYLFYDYEKLKNQLYDQLNEIESLGFTIKQNFVNGKWSVEIDKTTNFYYSDTKDGLNKVIKDLSLYIEQEKQKAITNVNEQMYMDEQDSIEKDFHEI